MCALCGESFAAEVLMGKVVQTFKQAGSDTTFCAHDKCLEDSKNCKTLLDLPEKSPLRQRYEQQERESAENRKGDRNGTT